MGRNTRGDRFSQVVAVDTEFQLLARVWCVAELVEAHRLHLHQNVMVHSVASRNQCMDLLTRFDVREASASFPRDKDLVLSKIADKDLFNEQLEDLVLHRVVQRMTGESLAAKVLN